MSGIITSYVNKLRKHRYHQRRNQEALQVLEYIKKNTNYELTEKEKKVIRDYAKEVLGSTVYSNGLYVYAAFNQKFVEGWIPDNYFGYVVNPKINKNIGEISDVKTLSKKLLQTNMLPDRYYLINNIFYDLDFNIVNENQIKSLVLKEGQDLYFKKDQSNQGKGVIKVTKENFDLKEIYSYGDCIVQDPIIQSNWFNNIITGSVATVRITTVKDLNHKMKKRSALLRVGRSDSQLVQAATSIKIPIIDDEGTLSEFALDSEWRKHFKHPDSGFEFANQKIPYFAKAVKKCEKMHEKLPHFSIIGWDVSITQTGDIKAIEWNAQHPGIKITEATTGPSFTNLGWENLWKE